MALSEIEKLERRYAENPQGLTFAPLAEVHRKNGEVQRALDLLGPGLQIHPDYIPASIVLGRCHMDLGDVHAAEAAFLHVLSLDGENVIALKALADISERLVRFDDAERWLHTLLTVDRSNDEAREQLQRVEIARRQAGVASSAEPSSVVGAPVDAGAASEAPAVSESVLPRPFEPPVAEPAVGWVSQSQGQTAPPMAMEDLEPSALKDFSEEPAGVDLQAPREISDQPVRPADSVEPIDGLVGRDLEMPDEADEFRVETSEDIVLRSAGGSEFQVPDASLELFAGGAPGERAPFEEDAPVPSRGSAESGPAPVTGQEPAAEPEPVAPTPEPVAVAPEPASEPAPDPEHVAASVGPAPAPPPRRSYGAAETGGRSVAQVFRAILSARPPAQASAPTVRSSAPSSSAGAPTRPAADALSLSSVFGEEGSTTPPAVPAPNPSSGAVSFDDFFGSPSGSSAARTPRAPDSKNDDLDQFHTWLQNLKR